jgi:hypothetical protein
MSILAHFHGVLHVANQKTPTSRISGPMILTTFSIVQSLSCARCSGAHDSV